MLNKYGLMKLTVLARHLFIRTAETPNPLCVKFLPGKEVMGSKGTREYRGLKEAHDSMLAVKLLSIEGVQKLLYGPDFISVTKADSITWEALKPDIVAALTDHFMAKDSTLFVEKKKPAEPAAKGVKMTESEREALDMIKDLIKVRVAPMLNADGGDIVFRGFSPKTGIVYVTMKGACEGCPSSSQTLKGGVERMLKFYIAEVTSVEDVPADKAIKDTLII